MGFAYPETTSLQLEIRLWILAILATTWVNYITTKPLKKDNFSTEIGRSSLSLSLFFLGGGKGFGFTASHLLGKHSTSWPRSLPFLVYCCSRALSFLPGAGQMPWSFHLHLLCTGTTGMYHHIRPELDSILIRTIRVIVNINIFAHLTNILCWRMITK
jgi:hypothetical protein